MTVQSHIAALEKKHGALEEKLSGLRNCSSSKDHEINDIKRRKLRIKDEMQRLTAQVGISS